MPHIPLRKLYTQKQGKGENLNMNWWHTVCPCCFSSPSVRFIVGQHLSCSFHSPLQGCSQQNCKPCSGSHTSVWSSHHQSLVMKSGGTELQSPRISLDSKSTWVRQRLSACWEALAAQPWAAHRMSSVCFKYKEMCINLQCFSHDDSTAGSPRSRMSKIMCPDSFLAPTLTPDQSLTSIQD